MENKKGQISFSKVDSERFSMRIFRATLDKLEPRVIRDELISNKADILILRMPVTSKEDHHLLSSTGFPFLHADTLVHYQLPLKNCKTHDLKNNLAFEVIDGKSAGELDKLVPLIFRHYRNHYFSNPFLDRKLINDGYLEWAKTYLHDEKTGRISWLVRDQGIPVAFATCASEKRTGLCEGILYGVHPDHEGRGIYSDLIRFTANYFKDQGYLVMDVSTQIQNFGVQKVWTREGFYLHHAFDTYHINAMLNKTTVSKE
jgi:GNAT superfamily N-acetyltransferase